MQIGYRRITFGISTTMNIVHDTTIQIDGGHIATAVGTGTEDIHVGIIQFVISLDKCALDVVRFLIFVGEGFNTMRTTENHVDITRVGIHMGISHRREVTTTINTMCNRRRTSIANGSCTQQDIGFGHFNFVGQVGITTTTTGSHSGCFHIGIGFATDNIFGIVRL